MEINFYDENRRYEDKETALYAIEKQDGYELQFCSPELRDDEEVVKCAVEKNGYSLEFASDRLKADYDVVSIAVYDSGDALSFASEELQADYDIVMTAVENRGEALMFASAELLADYDIVMTALKQGDELDVSVLEKVVPELLADIDIAKACVYLFCEEAIDYLPEEMKNNEELLAYLEKAKSGELYD